MKGTVGPNGYWCRACGQFQSLRTARQVTAARKHLQAHIDAGEQPKDGKPWVKS